MGLYADTDTRRLTVTICLLENTEIYIEKKWFFFFNFYFNEYAYTDNEYIRINDDVNFQSVFRYRTFQWRTSVTTVE